jgi:hypothetical protein
MVMNRFRACACRVGFSISNQIPHTVLSITEVMDRHGALQGSADYENEEISVGDVLIMAGGVSLESMTILQVKQVPNPKP